MTKKKKCEAIPPIKTEYLYYEEMAEFTKISTTNGDLVVPRIPKDMEEKLKKDGWHLLREQYYNTYVVDVLVLRFYTDPPCMRWKVFSDRGIDTRTNWWTPRCGEMIPPYEWNANPHNNAVDYVVGWKPHKGKTGWVGLV